MFYFYFLFNFTFTLFFLISPIFCITNNISVFSFLFCYFILFIFILITINCAILIYHKQNNSESNEEIKVLDSQIIDSQEKMKDVDNRLQKGQDYKENLLKSKHNDIDQELVRLNPNTLKTEIENFKNSSKSIQTQINEVKIIEPKEFYHEDQHDAVKDVIKSRNGELVLAENKVEEIQELIEKYGDGIQCEHCGIKLMEASLTKKKIEQLEGYKKLVREFRKEIGDLEKKEQSFTQLKKDFDEYERNKLIKEKYELSLESTKLKLEQAQDKLTRYEEVQDKIKKNNDIDAQLVKAGMRIDDLINEKRDYERTITSNQLQIKNLKQQIDKNLEMIQTITEEFEREKIYKIYLEVFGKNGISKIIMKTMMPLINQELQRLLMDSCYFNLEIRINDKNEVEFMMIDNSTGIEKPMTSGSGYERTIAAMALRAVLSKVCSLPKPNIIVWDEVFGKISNENLEMVGEFFSKMREYFEKIFVITHNPLVNNWANNVVRISKTENISKVSQ